VQLTADGILAVTRVVAEQVGLSAADPQIIKFTNSAVVRLPRAGAVVRIAGSALIRHRLAVVLAAARFYAAHEVPAVRLYPDVENPVHALDHVASVWIDGYAPDAATPGPADLAMTLKYIHAIDEPPSTIPAWDPVGSIRRRIETADGASDDDLSFLTHECNDVEAAVQNLDRTPPLLAPGLIHGDAFLGNLVPARPAPLICDFDSTAGGPREWDLTPMAVSSLRLNQPLDRQRDFARAYGLDVTTWDGFPTLRRLRELQLVTSALPTLNANPALRPQWEHRLASLKNHDTSVRWTPYSAS
jgi:aminoglycoside phosphotransferase (APT) family kinase protein